jgi:hypothetical protein
MKRKHLLWIVPTVLVLGFLTWNYWPMDNRLIVSPETTYITEPLDANGVPDYGAVINAKLSAGVTPENNAVVGLLKVLGTAHIPEKDRAGVLAELGVTESDFPMESLFLAEDDYCERNGIEIDDWWDWQDEVLGTREATGEEHPELAEWVDENTEALDGFVAASRRSTFCVVLPSDNLSKAPHALKLGNLMKVARAVSFRGSLRMAEGDVAGAMGDALACHRMGRLVKGSLLYWLVGEGLEGAALRVERSIVRSDEATREDLERLQRELLSLPDRETLREALETERLQTLGSKITQWRSGAEEEFTFAVDQRGVDINLTLRGYNEATDRLHAAFDGATYEEVSAAFDAISYGEGEPQTLMFFGGDATNDWPLYAWLGRMGRREYSRMVVDRELSTFGPHYPKLLVKGLAVEVQTQAVIVLIAARLYEMDHGEFPADMAALVDAGYLDAVPVDPFDGAPLRYLLTDDEVVVYSVGENATDDGGHDGRYGNWRECDECDSDCGHDDTGVILKR